MDEHSTRPGDRHYLFGMIRDIDRIEKHKQYLRDNSHELSQRSQQEMEARRNHYFQSMGAARQQAATNIVPKFEQKILSVLPKDMRRNLQNDLKYILDFDHWEPDVQMFAGVSAVVLPDLLDSYNRLRGQLREAKAELIKFRGGSPKVANGSRAPAAPKEEEETPSADTCQDEPDRLRRGIDQAYPAGARLPEVSRLEEAAIRLHEILWKNTGDNADWPISFCAMTRSG